MSGLHHATHMSDVLSGHSNRIVHHYGGRSEPRRNTLRHIIQEAITAYADTYRDVWGREYDGHDDNKELARFLARCVDDFLGGSTP